MNRFKFNNTSIRALSFLLGALFIGFIWVYITYLIPVGSVNGKNILRYEAMQRVNLDNAIKSIGKDKAFDAAMQELGISATNAEVEKEFNTVSQNYGGSDELQNILIDTQSNMQMLKNSIRKGILKQKAIERLAKTFAYTDETLKAFYEENKENYSNDFSEIKEQIASDYLMTKGAEKYEEFIKSFEDTVTIRIY